jgi:hypothetical protein
LTFLLALPSLSRRIAWIKPRQFPSSSFLTHYSPIMQQMLGVITGCHMKHRRTLCFSRSAHRVSVAEGIRFIVWTHESLIRLLLQLKLCNIVAFPNTTLKVTFVFQELCARLNVWVNSLIVLCVTCLQYESKIATLLSRFLCPFWYLEVTNCS